MEIGIIGAGKIAERHIHAYRALGCGKIAIFDVESSSVEDLAHRYNIDCVENQAKIMESQCDLVDICTPVTSHKDIILQALRYDKHVFCEKPLCLTLDEAYEIKDTAIKSKRHVMVGYLYRFHPAFQQVKRWVDERIIGSIHFGLFRIGGRGSHRKWKHQKEKGGGCINEMLIHKLDLINFYLGKIDSVKIVMKEVLLKERVINGENVEPDAEDNVVLQLRTGNTRAICQADLTSPSYMEYLELHGEYGSIFTSILDYFPTLLFLNKQVGIYNQGNNLFRFDKVNLFELELNHFFSCIQNGDKNMNSIDDSIEIMKIVEKIDRREN